MQHLEQSGRPFRLAIDYAIWSFQNQAGQGGRNPALRTLYYRCLKLLSLAIQPIFVFDGSRKPSLKRNTIVPTDENHWTIQRTKELLDAFGFTYHQAPGEAEAECAILQASGLVDAVLSEDVDTLMFGCGYALRNWSAEQSRAGKSPTHVSVHTAKGLRSKAGLDCQGLILVALMSGGDYDTDGVPGCGLLTACEAARAGFGKLLCELDDGDSQGMKSWRENLQHELSTNENKHFRRKHHKLSLPKTFPDKTVLGYYKHPIISDEQGLAEVETAMQQNQHVNISMLRAFVAIHFGWQYLRGAQRMIRGLAPALLIQKLLSRQDPEVEQSAEDKEKAEFQLINCISSRRRHWNTDGCQELRIKYVPAEIVGLDLTQEDRDSSAECQVLDDQIEEFADAAIPVRAETRYDPTEAENIWVLETFVKLGTPLLCEIWEEENLQNLEKITAHKAQQKKANVQLHPQHGDMDRYVKIRKGLEYTDMEPRAHSVAKKVPVDPLGLKSSGRVKSNQSLKKQQHRKDETLTMTVNPWSLSRRPSDTYSFQSPTRYSALGIYPVSDPKMSKTRPSSQESKKEYVQPLDDAKPLLSKDLSNVTVRTPKRTRSPKKTDPNVQKPECYDHLGVERCPCPLLEPGANLAGCKTFDNRVDGWKAISKQKNRNQSKGEEGPYPATISEHSTERPTKHSESTTRMRRLVALRQSLEGAWKYLEPEERQLAKVVFENVELLDLTKF